MQWLKHLWDFEIDTEQAKKFTWLPVIVVFLVTGYILLELLVMPPSPDFLTLDELRLYLSQKLSSENSFAGIKNYFPLIWFGLLAVTFCTRIFVSVYGYFIKSKVEDNGLLYRNILVYTSAGLMSIVISLLILLFVGLLFQLLGFSFSEGYSLFENAERHVAEMIKYDVPSLFVVPSKWMALLLAMTVYSLTGYFLHWLTHVSRFLWHVVHAPHHMPDFLHPIGNPLAYTFDFFLLVPKVISGAILTKLFYSGPIILETAIFALLAYNFEIFNHATVHYSVAQKNVVLRFLSQFFGGHGAYHYVHHSSAKEHQMANMGGGLFLMWDRIFGTFSEPPVKAPSIGWTNNPDIYMNPFRVIFGGPARIIYELRMNADWKSRFLILFGPINYKPPITIDYIRK